MKKLLTILFLTLWPSWAWSANRFWVIGTGTWDATAGSKWSTTSGGAGGASVPGTSDIAIFDANSGGGTVTKGAGGGSIITLNMSAAAAMTFAGSSNMVLSGDLTLGSSVTYTHTGQIQFGGGGTKTLTPNGRTIASSIDVSAGTLNLSGTFASTSTFSVTSGTFNTNNAAMTMTSFSASIATVSLGSSTITLTGTGSVWAPNPLFTTVTPGTSTIKMTNTSGSSVTFVGGTTYNNIWFARGASVGTNIVSSSSADTTFNDFKDDGTAAHQITLPSGFVTNVSTFTVSGNPGALISLRSDSGGSQATLSKPSGTVTRDYLDIQDSNAIGGATWDPGANSVNSGNNSGWTFPAPPISVVPTFSLRSP